MGTLGQRWRCPKVAEPATHYISPRHLEGRRKRTWSGNHTNFITCGVAELDTRKWAPRKQNRTNKLFSSKTPYPQSGDHSGTTKSALVLGEYSLLLRSFPLQLLFNFADLFRGRGEISHCVLRHTSFHYLCFLFMLLKSYPPLI